MKTWDALSVNANRMKILWNNTKKCLNYVFLLEQLKNYRGRKNLTQIQLRGSTAIKKTEQLYRVSSPCFDDHHFKKEELESVGEFSKGCTQIVLKCLYLARIGGPDILWSVNKLARSLTKWAQACDRRLPRLTPYIHHSSDCRQHCHVGNTALHCRLGLFQDSDFAGDLEDSRSTWEGEEEGDVMYLWKTCILSPSAGCARRKRQYPIVLQSQKLFRWMLDCEWMDYLLSIDVVFEELRSTDKTKTPTRPASGKRCETGDRSRNTSKTKQKGNRDVDRWHIWITFLRTHILLKASLSCTFLKITKQLSR